MLIGAAPCLIINNLALGLPLSVLAGIAAGTAPDQRRQQSQENE